MDNNQINSILNYIAHSNEFCSGKFIFANLKLGEIYDAMICSDEIMEFVEDCCEDFRYSLEFTKAFVKTPTKPGRFVAPKDSKKFVALCFNLLKDFKQKKFDFDAFILRYFDGDEHLSKQQLFAKQFVLPLKNIIADNFELSKDNQMFFEIEKTEQVEKEEVIEEKNENENFEQIKEVCKDLIEQVMSSSETCNQTKKSTVLILSQIIKSCDNLDSFNILALMIGLSFMEKEFKSLLHLFEELGYLIEKI